MQYTPHQYLPKHPFGGFLEALRPQTPPAQGVRVRPAPVVDAYAEFRRLDQAMSQVRDQIKLQLHAFMIAANDHSDVKRWKATLIQQLAIAGDVALMKELTGLITKQHLRCEDALKHAFSAHADRAVELSVKDALHIVHRRLLRNLAPAGR
jgi:phosphoenolpyruvate-protein kinase (PTS system EI component)